MDHLLKKKARFAGWWYSSTVRSGDPAADVDKDTTDGNKYNADRARLVNTAVLEGSQWNIYVYPKTTEATAKKITIQANNGKFSTAAAIGTLSPDKNTLTLYDADTDFDISGVEGYLTRDGYILQGYATSAVTPTAANHATIVAATDEDHYDASENQNLVAIWLPERNVITFADDDGTVDELTQTIEGTSTATPLQAAGPAVKQDGYTLYGWVGKNSNSEFDELIERKFESTSAADAAIKAVSGAKFYAIGGSIKTADIHTIGGAGTPAQEYFTGTTPATGWTTTVYGATLYPVYVANTYTVTYDLGTAPKATKYYNYNKSTILYSTTAQTITDTYVFNKGNAYAYNYSAAKRADKFYDTTAVLPKLADDIAPGYVFEGWYTDLNDPNSLIVKIATDSVLDTTGASIDYSSGASNLTVYAKWTPIEFYFRYTGTAEQRDGTATTVPGINGQDVAITKYQYAGLTPVLYSDGEVKFEPLNVLDYAGTTATEWVTYAATGAYAANKPVTPGKSYAINPNFINKGKADDTYHWKDADGNNLSYALVKDGVHVSRYSDGTVADDKNFYVIDMSAKEIAGKYTITPAGFTDDEWKIIKKLNPTDNPDINYEKFENGLNFNLPVVDGTKTGLFYREGYTFMGWTVTQTDGTVAVIDTFDAENVPAGGGLPAYFYHAMNYTTNVTIRPVYAEDVYYVAYAKNSAYKTSDDTTRTAVVPSAPVNSGELGDVPYEEFATEGLNFKGWYLESNVNKIYAKDTDVSKLAGSMKKASYDWTLVDGNPTGEVEVESAADAYNNSRWNWLFPQYDYTYMVVYASADGTSTNPAVELTESTSELPTDLFVESGKKATGWTLYKDAVAGQTYTIGQATAPYTWLKAAASAAGLAADEAHTITATLRVNVADAYTVNVLNGTENLMTLTYTSSEMGAATLRSEIYAKITKDVKAEGNDKKTARLAAEEADNTGLVKDGLIDYGWFAPSEEGKHFDGTVKYGTSTAAVKWSALTLSTLRSAADKDTRTVDVNVQMAANTYTVYYALKDTAKTALLGYENFYQTIAPTIIGTAGMKADGDVKKQSATVGKASNNSYTAGSAATSAKYKYGAFKQWQVVNLYPKTDSVTGNLTVIDPDDDTTYTTKVEGTLADGAAIEDLNKVQGGYSILYAQYDPKSYTITFANGQANLKNTTITGTMSPVTIVASDENLNKYIEINKFSAPGYTFTAWSKSPSAGTPDYFQFDTYDDVIKGAAYASEITLTAKWTVADYDIIYHMEGGVKPASAPAKYTIEAQKAIPKASDLTNYKFDGWYKDAAFKTPLDSTSTGYCIPAGSTGDYHLYAKWVPSDITIKFAANGGTGTMTDVSAKYNADVTLPANAFTKENYTFYGWSDGAKLYTDKATASFTAKTVTLTAQWANKDSKFVITLNTDSKIPFKEAPKGFTLSGNSKATYTYTYGDSLTLPKAATTNEQYTFSGWTDAATGEKITSVKKTTGGAINLNAVWTGKKYTVSYNANAPKNAKKVSGKTESTKVEYGTDWAPANCGTTVTGYEFKGWAKTATATTPDYSFQVSATGKNPFNYEKWEGTENLKLYAVWGATATYATFITVLEGATIDQNGFAAMGTIPPHVYGTDEINVIRYVDPDDGTGVTQDIYDKTIMSAYAYKYDASKAGTSIELPKAINNVTATFKGWYAAKKDAAGYYTATPTGKKITSIKPGDDGVYVAKWEGNYEIRYHSGADEKVVTMTNKIGKKVKLTKIDKNWYDSKTQVFVGWSTVENGAIKYKNKASLTLAATDLTVATTADKTLYIDLYANYADKNATYNVTYLDSNGNVAQEATYKYNKGISTKTLKKVGKAIAKNDGITYGGFVTTPDSAWISDKLSLTKIPKKTPGDLILRIVPKGGKKISVSFDANASTIDVKVKGKVSKKTIKENTKYLKSVNKFTAKGYTLVGYSLTPGATAFDYALTPKKLLYAEEIFGDVSDSAITLYAVWANSDLLNPVDTHYHYYAPSTTDAIDFASYVKAGNSTAITTKNAADPTNGTMYYHRFDSSRESALPRPSRLGYNFNGWEELQANGSWKATSSTASSNVIRYFRATWTKVK